MQIITSKMDEEYADLISHITPNLFYTSESIPTEELEEIFYEIFAGCNCSVTCEMNCLCINKSGIVYDNKILSNIDNSKPAYECNSNCKCSDNCRLKVVSRGPINNLNVLKTEGKGFGLFTNAFIASGKFVCEYAGELITENEAAKRYEYYKQIKMNYIFWIKEHFGEKTSITIIDPTQIGNIGRFINHSCDPNCLLIPVRIKNTLPKLCIFSKRDIKENEELCFDYGSRECGLINSGLSEKTACLCNNELCQKYLPFHTA